MHFCSRLTAVLFLLLLACPGAVFAAATPTDDGAPLVLAKPLREVVDFPALKNLPNPVKNNPNAWVWLVRAREKKTPAVSLRLPCSNVAWPAQNHALGAPLNAYALMIDDSQSMREAWTQAREAMKQAWALLSDSDLAGLYAFSEKLTVLRDLEEAGERQGVAEKIDALAAPGRTTAMYEALQQVFTQLAASPALNRHVFLFTDGDAEDESRTLQEVIAEAARLDIRVHCLGFEHARKDLTQRKQTILQRLAAESGGLYAFFSGAGALKELLQKELAGHSMGGVLEVKDVARLPYGLKEMLLRFDFGPGGADDGSGPGGAPGTDGAGSTNGTVGAGGTNGTVGVGGAGDGSGTGGAGSTNSTAGAGRGEILEVPVVIVGTEGLDNFLVLVSARSGVQNPWLVLATPPLALLLLLFTRAQRRRRLAREWAEQAARLARIQEEQAEQNARLEEARQALSQVAEKVSRFDPDKQVNEQGKPYGWLIEGGGPRHPLITFSTRIGRGKENDVVLQDPHVSSEHAILDLKRGAFVWTDRAPVNPTVINGEAVSGSKQIWPGDAIVCGGVTLRFVLDSGEGDLQSAATRVGATDAASDAGGVQTDAASGGGSQNDAALKGDNALKDDDALKKE